MRIGTSEGSEVYMGHIELGYVATLTLGGTKGPVARRLFAELKHFRWCNGRESTGRNGIPPHGALARHKQCR